jgi:protocatechuate 3,4-dioxygenase beta subunit
MRRAAFLLVALAAGCGGSSDDPPDRPDRPEPDRAAAKRACEPTAGEGETVMPSGEATASRVRLGPGMELKATKRNLAAARVGRPLVVTGLVRGDDCAPLAGATIHAWQTNGRGRYGPVIGGQDRCCYLTGTVRTGDNGRYTLDTVMPRGYQGGPAHIHMEVGHPDAEGIVTELVFDAPAQRSEFDIVLRRS